LSSILPLVKLPDETPLITRGFIQCFVEGSVVNGAKVGTLENHHRFEAINLSVIVGISDLLSDGSLIPNKVRSQRDLGGSKCAT
jgi:hypothetical protein